MPKAATHTLVWSSARGAYELRSLHTVQPLPKEDRACIHHLVDGPSFAFRGQHGHLTLRKEARQHGEGYWYAYRSQGRKTLKKYAGRPANLTIARLESIAQELNAVDDAKPPPFQTSPLLVPKLFQPRLHAALVHRERLLALLDAGLEGKLTLISAPAGFGKTTLVSQWCVQYHTTHAPSAAAWVSLDPGDNDPIRFWSYVLAACQVFLPSSSPFEPASLEATLTRFLNALSQLPHRNILVLEDYHVISSPHVHETLAFLIEHLPPTLHVIVITRVDPPLPLAHWRAHHDLHELRVEDLRFSLGESQAFLSQVVPFSPSQEVITRLDAHLEGWVTGLRLVALALHSRSTPQAAEAFLATVSGNQRHILEFFVTVVLATQPESLQLFLLQTSVLSRLSGPLCDAVTGSNESEQFLKALEDANLFLQPLDDSGQWYRYHLLFAEAMQQEARQRFGEEALQAWCSRASGWYEQEGMLSEAVEMAFAAWEHDRAAALIEQSLKPHYAYHQMGEQQTLQRWLDLLPGDVLRQHPRLCARAALLLVFWERRAQGQSSPLAQIERLLDQAEEVWQAEGNLSGLGETRTFRAFLWWEQGEVARAACFAREALALLPPGEAQWRGSCFRMTGEEELLAGQTHEASQHFREALALFETVGNSSGARAARLALAQVCWLQGALRQAAELYRAALASAGDDLVNTSEAQFGLARLSYEWNALETAEQEAQEALDLGARLNDRALHARASLVLARIEQARGQTTQAQQRLHTLLARLPGGLIQQSSLLYRHILAGQARLSLGAGDLVAAERWSETSTIRQDRLPLLYQEQEALIMARLLMAQGHAEEALRLLECWQVKAQQQGRARSEVEILVLMALAYFAQQRQSQATSRLRAALALAQAEGYQRLFLDEGAEMAALLRVALPMIREDRAEPYARMLMRAFSQQGYEQGATLASSTCISTRLIEPLSPQEQRVLCLLATGSTNPEIAEALVVSINTVKTQVRSIYRKLNVKSRKEAREVVRSQNQL